MKRILALLTIFLFVSLTLVTGTPIVQGEEAGLTSGVRPNIEELTEESTHIIIGEVEQIRSEWNEEETMIFSYVTISVEAYLKGNSKGRYVTVRHQGGEVGDIGVGVSGEPDFAKGEKVKAFLRLETSGEFSVVGGGQGKISLTKSGAVELSPAGYSYTGIHWNPADLPVEYYINSAGTPDTAWEFYNIQEAFQTWEVDPRSTMDYTYMGTTSRGEDVYDGYNVVSWDYMDGVGGVLAHCVYRYWIASRELIEFDITFDEYETWSVSGEAGKFDVRNVGTHEVGHTLVLKDLYDPLDGDETMYGYSSTGQIKRRTLYVGDVAGLRFIYGYARGSIYWDDYHDTDGDSIGPGGNYEDLATELTGAGYYISEKSVPITASSLAGYDVLVIVDPETPLSASEISAIQTWIDVGGHGLFVMGEAAGFFDAASVNSLLSPYGISISGDIWPDVADSFIYHAVTAGVSTIDLARSGYLDVSSPSIEIGWADTGECVLAAYESHPPSSLGGVVVLPDSAPLDNGWLYNYDNLVFALNVFKWLSQLTPTLINIETELQAYWPGDTMRLGIEVINLGDAEYFSGGAVIYVELPDGSAHYILDKSRVTIPAGYEYINMNWKTFVLPGGLDPGKYVWHAALCTRKWKYRIYQTHDTATFYMVHWP